MGNVEPDTGYLNDRVYALLYICGRLKLNLKGSKHSLMLNETLQDMCSYVILVHDEPTA